MKQKDSSFIQQDLQKIVTRHKSIFQNSQGLEKERLNYEIQLENLSKEKEALKDYEDNKKTFFQLQSNQILLQEQINKKIDKRAELQQKVKQMNKDIDFEYERYQILSSQKNEQ